MSEYKPYTGIGSRETPPESMAILKKIAQTYSKLGYTLRSGGADGADEAFEKAHTGSQEIFLPWQGFNNRDSRYYKIPPKAFDIAASIHPAWDKMSPRDGREYSPAQCLHARNVQQIMGSHLNSPTLFVVFYAKEELGKVQGGTATAVNLARSLNIPTFNIQNENRMIELREMTQYELQMRRQSISA